MLIGHIIMISIFIFTLVKKMAPCEQSPRARGFLAASSRWADSDHMAIKMIAVVARGEQSTAMTWRPASAIKLRAFVRSNREH